MKNIANIATLYRRVTMNIEIGVLNDIWHSFWFDFFTQVSHFLFFFFCKVYFHCSCPALYLRIARRCYPGWAVSQRWLVKGKASVASKGSDTLSAVGGLDTLDILLDTWGYTGAGYTLYSILWINCRIQQHWLQYIQGFVHQRRSIHWIHWSLALLGGWIHWIHWVQCIVLLNFEFGRFCNVWGGSTGSVFLIFCSLQWRKLAEFYFDLIWLPVSFDYDTMILWYYDGLSTVECFQAQKPS